MRFILLVLFQTFGKFEKPGDADPGAERVDLLIVMLTLFRGFTDKNAY
ncbi:MAG: hypothetical protein WAM58_07505 [Candidatus Acidiferrum sp.]